MTQSGRYGKYGESKRYDRLRKSKGSLLSRRAPEASRPGKVSHFLDTVKRRTRIKIQQAGRSETGFVRRLSRDVFQDYGTYDEIIPQWAEAKFTVTLVGYLNHKPVGFAMLAPSIHEQRFSGIYELLAIAVVPAQQGRGMGSRLLDAIEKRATRHHVRRIILHTAKENLPARRLFSAHGYRRVAVKGRFYPRGQDAVMMLKEIG